MLLVTGSETSSSAVYQALLRAASSDEISTTALRASYDRILVLKTGLH